MTNYMATSRIDAAKQFAIKAHGDQVRKYTGLPYVVHTFEVGDILNLILPFDIHKEDTVMAGILHDTIEDTLVTYEDLASEFGILVADKVHYVSDISVPEDGNRKVRKEIDAQHYVHGDYYSQSVKYADLISNTGSIVAFDPNFAHVYLREKEHLLELMTKGNAELRAFAYVSLTAAQTALMRSTLK